MPREGPPDIQNEAREDHRYRMALLTPPVELQGPIGHITQVLADELRSLGCEVDLYSWGRRRERQSAIRRAIDRLADVGRISGAVSRRRYDALVINTSHDWATVTRDLLLIAKCRQRPPTVLYFHGSSPRRAESSWPFRLATKWLARHVTLLLLLSSEEADSWRSLAGDVPVRTVSNPYRSTVTEPVVRESAAGDEIRLLFVGRLIPEKGAETLLRAAAQLGDLRLRIVIAGDGPRAQHVRHLADQVPVPVEVPGFLGKSALDAEYRRAHIFVLPTTWDEGFPTVLAEALDYGLPIITTKTRGAADHLTHGENALLVQPDDMTELTSAIRHLVADRDLRARMGHRNRQLVESFAPDKVARHFVETLSEILKEDAS